MMNIYYTDYRPLDHVLWTMEYHIQQKQQQQQQRLTTNNQRPTTTNKQPPPTTATTTTTTLLLLLLLLYTYYYYISVLCLRFVLVSVCLSSLSQARCYHAIWPYRP